MTNATGQVNVQLPLNCEQHPAAPIRRSWTRRQYVMNGYPSGQPLDSDFRFECSECGRELASSAEYEQRTGRKDSTV